MDEDQEQFFKDLSATVEQTVEEVHAVEGNYFYVLQKTISAFPLVSDLNKKLQSYAEQYVSAGLEFAHKLSEAKDLQDFPEFRPSSYRRNGNRLASRQKISLKRSPQQQPEQSSCRFDQKPLCLRKPG
jgi:hypothetical protein